MSTIDPAEIISGLKIPKVFREVIALAGGAGFLLLLWLLKLKNFEFNPGVNFLRPEIDSLVILAAYLTGKILLAVSDILNWIDWLIDFTFSENKEIRSNFEWKSIRRFMAYRSSVEPIEYKKVKDRITSGEIWKELADHKLFEEAFERDRQFLLFLEFFICYAILIVLLVSAHRFWSILATVFLVTSWYGLRRHIFFQWIRFQEHMVKHGSAFSKEKDMII